MRPLLPRGPIGDEALGDLHEDFHLRLRRRGGDRPPFAVVATATALYLLGALVLTFTLSIPAAARGSAPTRPSGRKEHVVVSFLAGLALDLRTAARSLRRRPLLSLVAIGSLSIGLGANTAIFSLINVLFLAPLPGVDHQERAVEIGRTSEGSGFDTFNYLDYQDLKSEATALDELALWTTGDWSLATGDGGRRVGGLHVTPSYFRTLGVDAARGRLLRDRPEDDLGERGVVVLSHRTWTTLFDGDETVVGSEVLLNRRRYTVVGVTEPEFRGHVAGLEIGLFAPLSDTPEIAEGSGALTDLRYMSCNGLSWLAPAHSAAQADAQVRTVMRNLAETYPDSNGKRGATVVPLGPIPGAGRGPAGGFSALLMGLVILLLAATCANVAGILTARALGRERELGTRLALGCGRPRLMRLLLLEALLLSGVGGALGLLLAWVGLRSLDFGKLPTPIELRLDLTPDLRVFAFCFALAAVAALALGLPAAWQASLRPAGASLLGGGWRGGAAGARGRRLFVGIQVAGATVLALVGALFLRSLDRAGRIHVGFEPSGVVLTSIDLSLEGYQDADQGLPLLERIVERVQAIPGVEHAALAKDLPLDLSAHGTGVVPESWDRAGERRALGVDFNQVSPGYFATLRIPLLQGRALSADDDIGAERVAVVSRTFAERWPESEVVGARFRWGSLDGPWVRVVGVVEDVKNQMLMEGAKPHVYMPLAQEYEPRLTVLARASSSERAETSMAAELRAAVLEVDPSLSLTPVMTLAQMTGIGTLPQRMAAGLGAVLGGFALLLAGLGIYGVIAYQVAQRGREIGLRMALGEARGAVTRRILKGAFRLVLPGLVVGSLAGAGLARLLRGMLLGLSPLDPVSLVAVALTLSGLVILASLFPARRASRIEPAAALRSE